MSLIMTPLACIPLLMPLEQEQSYVSEIRVAITSLTNTSKTTEWCRLWRKSQVLFARMHGIDSWSSVHHLFVLPAILKQVSESGMLEEKLVQNGFVES